MGLVGIVSANEIISFHVLAIVAEPLVQVIVNMLSVMDVVYLNVNLHGIFGYD